MSSIPSICLKLAVALLKYRSTVCEGVRKVGKQPKAKLGNINQIAYNHPGIYKSIRSFHKIKNSIGSVVTKVIDKNTLLLYIMRYY